MINCPDCKTCAKNGTCIDPELVYLTDNPADDTMTCYDHKEVGK